MVWLLAGIEQRAAKDEVTGIIAREWGARCDRDEEMAEDIVAGLYRAGYRVVREGQHS